MGILDYYFRTARFEYIRFIESHTIVVFVHGILSDSQKAFRIHNGNVFFWDLLKDKSVFRHFDFAHFSYGKIDLSYLLELDYPVNNLMRIAYELNGYIADYKNVLFIAHSQGGLLAKTYASLFYKEQGIHLVTLHTPHRNKSFSVMRFNGNEIWDKEACYVVPHIFCGSIADRKIVKPDNAFETGHDRRYLSRDQSKTDLGHSHLSSNPDEKLLLLYFEDIFNYINSGLSKIFCDTSRQIFGNYSSRSIIVIEYSRSVKKLSIDEPHGARTRVLKKPWSELPDLEPILKRNVESEAHGSNCNVLIQSTGCSVNYFAKYLSFYFSDDTCIQINSLDCGGESRIASNARICEWVFENRYSESNPYKHLPFDIHDFKKGALIEDDEFLTYFLTLLVNQRITIAGTYESGEYNEAIRECYCNAAAYFRRNVAEDIYHDCFTKASIGIEKFELILIQAVSAINALSERKNLYSEIYKIIKRVFEKTDQYVGIKEAEIIVSKLMRSDGEVYWLDKYWGQIFDMQKIKDAIT